ncbi:MAG: hypothetical protein LBO80_09640 [Treponema sp.]|jgi:hypothetical protein|nr:hypothetical protein [Treponema sp.]
MKYRNSFFAGILFFMCCFSVSSDSISAIWEAEPYQHFRKGRFSWGENVFSTGSVIIDLEAAHPYISCHSGGAFFVSKIEYEENQVVLLGEYSDDLNVEKKIIIHILDKDSISIELIGRSSNWLPLFPGSENRFYRVPKDAPYEPLDLDIGI